MTQVWQLAFAELKYKWLGLCGMVVLSLLVGYVIGSNLQNYALYGSDSMDAALAIAFDFCMIAVLPCFGGITMGKEYMSLSTISDEPFLRRLRFYRLYPIPLNLIVWSRICFMLICFIITVPLMFLTATFVAWPDMASILTGIEFFYFMLIWFGYALAMSGLIPYIEFGTNGKVLIYGSFFSAVLLILVVILIHATIGQSILLLSIQWVQAYSWLPGAIMLLTAVLGVGIWKRKLQTRIVQRDFP